MIREVLTTEKLTQLPPRNAAALLLARRSEGLSADEQQILKDWLARDESHRRAFEMAERAWQSFDDSHGDEILSAMRAQARAPRSRALPRWWPIAAAAALGVVAMAFVFTNPWTKGLPDGQGAEVHGQYTSANGEVKELQLPDGSHITLDADSAVATTFTTGRRSVELRKGRALFAVAKNASRPFTVSAAGRSVVAVGTRFDVNMVPDGLTVTLLEGRVDVASLHNGRALVSLSPGQQFVERSGDVTVRTIGASTENVTAWRRGLVNFDDQPLAEAAAIMNRYSSDQIVIFPEVASIRVSGQFHAGDTQRFASTVAEMHRLRLRHQDNRIELGRDK